MENIQNDIADLTEIMKSIDILRINNRINNTIWIEVTDYLYDKRRKLLIALADNPK